MQNTIKKESNTNVKQLWKLVHHIIYLADATVRTIGANLII